MNTHLADFKQAVISAFHNYAVFTGRATRPQFWYFYLFCVLGNVFFQALDIDILYALFSLATFVPLLAVAARRLHDVNRSGWWQLIGLTVIGLIPLVYWLCQPPVTDNNRFAAA